MALPWSLRACSPSPEGKKEFGWMMRRGGIGWFLAVTAFLFVAGCNDYNYTIQTPTGSTLTFLAPQDASAGGPAFTLRVSAAFNSLEFDKTTVVMWNGSGRTTTLVSAAQVTAAINASDIANPGTVQIQTVTKQSGQGNNGLSNTLPFFINPSSFPVPTVTSLSPSSKVAGGADFQLTVNGTNFVQSAGNPVGSVVVWNKNNLVTTFVTATQLTATVPSAFIASPGNATITVVNPSPGGGPSPSGVTFTITSTTAASTGGNFAGASIRANWRYVALVSQRDSGREDGFFRHTCHEAPPAGAPAAPPRPPSAPR